MTDKVQKIREEVVGIINSINHFTPDEDGKNSSYEIGKLDAASTILQVIDSLQEEPLSEIDFEQELYKAFGHVKDFTLGMWIAKRFYEMGRNHQEPISEEFEKALAEEWKGYNERGAALVDALEDNTQELAFAKGFYRGSKWQKEQDQSTIELAEDHAMLTGMEKMKEEMMAKAVDGEVTYGKSLAIPSLGYRLDKERLDFGDKVKVIVIKED